MGESRIPGPDIVFMSMQELLFIAEVSNDLADLNVEVSYLLLCPDNSEMLIHGDMCCRTGPCSLTNILAHFSQKIKVCKECILHDLIPG